MAKKETIQEEQVTSEVMAELLEGETVIPLPKNGPTRDLAAAILIEVYPNGYWELKNVLNDEPLVHSNVYDLLTTIAEEFGAEIQAEKVLAKIRQKLGGTF
jgi:hypothetical protein